MADYPMGFGALTSKEREKLAGPPIVLLPVGSVEPHGPHLSLDTDTQISFAVAKAALIKLADLAPVLIAEAIPYGVTECARAFPGAVSVSKAALEMFVNSVVSGFLADGARHVCVLNNHLEPGHEAALRQALAGFSGQQASLASPLERRFARRLSDEFKAGTCHAGQYETSIMLAAARDAVRESIQRELPPVSISLSQKIKEGIFDFREMGLEDAYAGSPGEATETEGQHLIGILSDMVNTIVRERCLPGD